MKKLALILLLSLMSLGASAEGWEYDNNKAIIVSIPTYEWGDEGTSLSMMVCDTQSKNGDAVLLYLYGDVIDFDFRPKQQYIVVSFFDHKKDTRWRIRSFESDGHTFLAIVDSANFIKRLRNSQTISITLPVYEQGTHTFSFSAYGYPLDW